jgi:hypothetical protein
MSREHIDNYIHKVTIERARRALVRERESIVSTQSERLSIEQVSERTGADGKSIRAYLRKNFTRASEVKGSRWGDAKHGHVLTVKQTRALVEHFSESKRIKSKSA